MEQGKIFQMWKRVAMGEIGELIVLNHLSPVLTVLRIHVVTVYETKAKTGNVNFQPFVGYLLSVCFPRLCRIAYRVA